MNHISRDKALELLKKYNKDPFHIQHAFTVEAVMKWYANELGYGEDAEYWGIVDFFMILILNYTQKSIVSKHRSC